MAKPKAPTSNRLRTPAARTPAAAGASAGTGAVAARAEQHAPKKRISPLQFFREVRVEARRITWPSRRETWITTVMVVIMVLVTGLFFVIVDFVLSQGVQFVLKIPQMVAK